METKKSGLWVAAIAASAVAIGVALFRTKDAEPGAAPETTPLPAQAAQTINATATGSPASSTPTAPPSAGPVVNAPTAAVPGGPAQSIAPNPPPRPVHDPDGPPPPPSPPEMPKSREQAREVVDHVQFTIRDYRAALKENPVGNNAEITRALLGDNLKQVKFSVPEGSQLNGQGELCDPWGTPYFFHALARDQMEIRSAGPDRTLWTPDDIQQ